MGSVEVGLPDTVGETWSMKSWWRRMPMPTSVLLLCTSAACLADITLLVLAGAGRIDYGWPAGIGSVLFVLILIGLIVVGYLNGRHELDEVVRRLIEEEEERTTD